MFYRLLVSVMLLSNSIPGPEKFPSKKMISDEMRPKSSSLFEIDYGTGASAGTVAR